MSHYMLYLITPIKFTEGTIDNLMAPFYEDLEVAPYISSTVDEIYPSILERYNQYPQNERLAKLVKMPKRQAVIEFEYLDHQAVDEDGNIWSTYNQNAKWDWYRILNGGPEKTFPKRVKDIVFEDIPCTEAEQREKFPDLAQKYDELVSGQTKSFFNLKYLQERYPDLKSYLQDTVWPGAWAVLKDGEWTEPGTVGWFGTSSASVQEEREWPERFKKIIEQTPDNWWVTVIDCHI